MANNLNGRLLSCRYAMEGSRLDGSELVAALGLVFVVSGVTLWWQSILPTTDSVQAAL